jgi:flagellar hook-associated protein 2
MTAITTGTNIDVNTLVTQLMQVERLPEKAMQTQQSSFQTKITAYGQLQSALSSLGSAVSTLASTSTFLKNTASVSDSTVLSASAGTSAAAGVHTVEVQKLAQTQQLASSRFASTDTAVGTGTLTFSFGTTDSGSFTANPAKNSFSVTIDASNNTLAGVRDAINKANSGVRATIVNDGSGYRLALAPADSGKANGLKITATDADGNNTDAAGLSQLAFDPLAAAGSGKNLTENVAAQDAQLLINGISVTKPTNSVSDAIPGLTLNLTKTNVGSPVTVNVASDTASVKDALSKLVTAYNTWQGKVKDLTYYDASNKKAGTLQGDATARSVVSQVKNQLTSSIPGLSGGLSMLSQVGVSFQADGTLALDSGKLEKALANPDFNVSSLFAASGKASSSFVSYQDSSSTTPAGNYAVAITQAATRGTLAGNAAAGLTITAGVNDALNLTVNGQAVSVTLNAGTYASADALAAEVQTRLNNSSTFTQAGVSVAVSQNGGVLSIASSTYGSTSAVTGASGSAVANLFGTTSEAAGTDVQGTIGGQTASGSGQSLTAPNGLRLKITSTSTGSLGNVTVSNGYATQLSALIDSLSDTNTGAIASRTTGLNNSIKRITAQIDSFESRMTTLEANYRRQFSALDSALSSMNSTSTYLKQQLASLSSSS